MMFTQQSCSKPRRQCFVKERVDNFYILTDTSHVAHEHRRNLYFILTANADSITSRWSTQTTKRQLPRCLWSDTKDTCSSKTATFVTGRMPRSGKLLVLNLLTGQKSGFSPRRGDSLHRFTSNLAGPTDTWVRLAVQNFTSIAPGGWECGPKNIKNFHFLVKSRPTGATPLTDFQNF